MHGLEVTESGEVAFALRGGPAWHNLANVIYAEDQVVTTADMLRDAHLAGWNVRTLPLAEALPQYHYAKAHQLIVRDNPFTDGQVDVLGVAGDRFAAYQNEQALEWADALLDGGGRWESAGSINDGRRIFASLAIDHEFVIDPLGAADTVQTYLIVAQGHDGTMPVTGLVSEVRPVCQNTLNFALRGAKQTFKIRHTKSVGDRVAAAREALNITFKHAEALEAEATALYEVAVTNDQFFQIINAAYPMPDEDVKVALKKWETKVDLISEVYASDTCENIRGTAWGALNALTEFLDYKRSPRGGDRTNLNIGAAGFDAVTNTERNRLLSVVKDFAGV